MGKTLVNESLDRFAGVYAGGASDERVRAAVEDAETLVSIGVVLNDTLTAGFTDSIDPERVISVDSGVSSVGGQMFAPSPSATPSTSSPTWRRRRPGCPSPSTTRPGPRRTPRTPTPR